MPLWLRMGFWVDAHMLHPLEFVLPYAYHRWLTRHVCPWLERHAGYNF